MNPRHAFRVLPAAIVVIGVVSQPPARTVSKPLSRVLDAWDQRMVNDQRVVKGHETTLDAHPWQVALLAARVPTNTLSQFCGGSAIAGRWVLTAAHCVDGATVPDDVDVLTGTASLETGGRRLRADRIVVHEQWNPVMHDFDVAVVRVSDDLGRQPIAGLKTSDPDPAAGQNIVITGWGALAWQDQRGSKVLQEAVVPSVSRDTCKAPGSYPGQITDNMLCAGKALGGPDACQGDSGGPATSAFGTVTKLVGIVSWGDGCGFPKKFGVYTRVSRFADWIAEKTEGAVRW